MALWSGAASDRATSTISTRTPDLSRRWCLTAGARVRLGHEVGSPVLVSPGREASTSPCPGAPVDVAGWVLADASGQRENLAGILGAGPTVLVRLRAVQPGSRGDTLMLMGRQGEVVDQTAYQAN